MITKLLILLFTLLCLAGNVKPHTAEDAACQKYYSREFKGYVYTRVDIEPEFPGGGLGYQRFLNRNLRIPQEIIDEQEPLISPIMKFIVDTDGQIKNITINNKERAEDMDPMEKENLRLVKLMPKWIPGICQGKPVTAELKRPLFFCIRLEAEN
jgi:protein TonB